MRDYSSNAGDMPDAGCTIEMHQDSVIGARGYGAAPECICLQSLRVTVARSCEYFPSIRRNFMVLAVCVGEAGLFARIIPVKYSMLKLEPDIPAGLVAMHVIFRPAEPAPNRPDGVVAGLQESNGAALVERHHWAGLFAMGPNTPACFNLWIGVGTSLLARIGIASRVNLSPASRLLRRK